MEDKGFIKNIIIAVLCIALIGESVALVLGKIKSGSPAPSTPAAAVVKVDATGVVKTLQPEINSLITKVTDGVTQGEFDIKNLKGEVRKLIYSDTIVSTIMSLAYPLLYDTLDNLGLMDFAEYVSLFPKGPQAATKLKGKGYTACDKSGQRKDLGDVLTAVGDNWDYMNAKVKLDAADSDEEAVTLWYTIDWGVTDKESFYKAMNDMGEVLRGALEVGLQGKQIPININAVDYLLGIDAVNINLDAANVFNASAKTGYESGLIYLFNMLGLNEGEYPSAQEYNAYTSISDIWQGILEPVLLAVEKIFDAPIDNLIDLLTNFVVATESGELVSGIRTIRMDATYNPLAASVMGFEDGEVFNIGGAIIDMIESIGIKLSGNFNQILDSLLALITKSEAADMPDMDVSVFKAYSTPSTLPNGNTHYKADSTQIMNYLISYAVNENIVKAIIDLTPLKGTAEGQRIITAVSQSKDGIAEIGKVLFSLIADKLK